MNEHLSEQQMRQIKLDRLADAKIEAYPAQSQRTATTADFLLAYDDLAASGKQAILVGRVMLEREHGKVVFYQLLDGAGRLQLVLSAAEVAPEVFTFFSDIVDVGDFIQVTGTPFETKKGERSLLVHAVTLLSKAINPLPDKWHGIQDEEARYRKRYLDILMNEDVKNIFIMKSKFWSATRNFLTEKGYIEVETPVLENTTGGADANPFVTHHNALDIDVYLRISMGELWQKRLMVAGFEKTFEIGRQFRNEGQSPEHLQDYTQMEMYWAYADYKKGMSLVEEMYTYIISHSVGSLQRSIRGFDIDFEKKWEQLDYTETVLKMTGVNVLSASNEELVRACADRGLDVKGAETNRGRLIDMLWKQCRKQIAGPAFLVNHPVEVSPLAKRRVEDPRTVERFQVIIAGSEIGNGYSELNDPRDQRARFEEQAELRASGDAEAQMNDEEFVEALEFGMPPTFGFGFSERLFSFLLDKPIKECVLFPLLRPQHHVEESLPAVDITIAEPAAADVHTEDISMIDFDAGISLEAAEILLTTHVKDAALLRHNRATGYQAKAIAQRLGAMNPEAWYIAGILHDVDYESTDCTAETHGHIGADILTAAGVHPIITEAVRRHNPFNNSGEPVDMLGKALRSAEQLTGLVTACVAVRPDKDIASIEVKSVRKKLKDNSFAKGVQRDWIGKSEEWLGISTDELIELTLQAMKEHAHELELGS